MKASRKYHANPPGAKFVPNSIGSTRPRALIRSAVTLRSTAAPRFAERIDSGCQEQAAWLKTAARISHLTIPWAEPEIITLDTWWFAASEALIMFGGPALRGVMMRSSQSWIVWEMWGIQHRPIAVAGLPRGGPEADRLHQGRDSAPSASSAANHRTFILAWFLIGEENAHALGGISDRQNPHHRSGIRPQAGFSLRAREGVGNLRANIPTAPRDEKSVPMAAGLKELKVGIEVVYKLKSPR
jgi:hypothetical protein